jgi:DNA polymerase III epsilon subunit-like protein
MACKINGFTDEYVENNGMPISEALKNLKDDLKGVSIIIGHNLEFHLKAIQAECLRDGNTLIEFKNLILIDLIDFNHNMDYPKMKDLCEKILGEELKLKSRYTNVVYLRKIFDKLYNTMESDIKTGTAQ